MTAPEVELRRVWCRVAGRPTSAGVPALEALLAHLREPHRRYHTAVHVMWVLRHVEATLRAPTTPTVVDPDALRWAALYHDAIYLPERSDNEARSAALAVAAAADIGWPADRRDTVHRLILATATHTLPGDGQVDAATAVLLDADLAILGAEPAEYAAYVRGVRQEYAHVDDAGWRAGRAAVLRGFLAQPVLYRTAHMRAEREHRARANLAAELAVLEQ
ncbi:MAG: hypothetical protein H6513_00670 [Acidimicrobiaceae bacterium]|nr:hypothetical protein [Ilumatobacter sp.]MCB9379183.1 hypothetical protein [Acidimicrobiaceae bacterium]MCO5330526.1 hypothetical protein [Ilumatobacteraceae bacterium]